VDALVAALTEAVRELERPVDAIRHQAKVVTVGTSRAAERPAGPIFDALEEAGVPEDAVPDGALAALRAVQPAIGRVEGWARYRVEGLDEDGAPTEASRVLLEARGGISATLPSRAEGGAPLKGTKRGVVAHRRPFVGIGAKDGRTLAIVPLLDERLRCPALVLLHLAFRERMPAAEKAAVAGPRRLEEIVNGVTEADVPWTDALLDGVSPRDLVCLPPAQVVAAIVARARPASSG
jgi:glucosamine--fructose-6-phosphate aminotransferase (isomerizing)